jgi:ribonuclease P protein component
MNTMSRNQSCRGYIIMKPHGFPKSGRLLTPREFDRVFSRRCAMSDERIVLHATLGISEEPRLGLVVSRKVGNAVERNRWKRILREAFRLTRDELPNLDFAVIPRSRELPTLAELQDSFRKLSAGLARRLGAASKESP